MKTIKDALVQVAEAAVNINPLEGAGFGKAIVFLNDDVNRYSFKAKLTEGFTADEMVVEGKRMTVIALPQEDADAHLLHFIHEAEKEQVTAAHRLNRTIVKFMGHEFDDYEACVIMGKPDVIDGKRIQSKKGLKGSYYLFNNKLEFTVIREASRKDKLTLQYTSILGARK